MKTLTKLAHRMALGFSVLAMVASSAATANASDPAGFTTIDYPGAINTYLKGINPRGDIVGGYQDSNTEHGFLLRHAEFSSFDYPGAVWTEAEGISPQGDIVGQYGVGDGTTHGFLLRDGVFYPIDVPGQPNTMPVKINPEGTIVGCYHVNNPNGTTNLNTMYGYVMSPDGAVTSHPMNRTMNNGVNPAGDIAGLYFDPVTGRVLQSYVIRNGEFTWFRFSATDLATQAWDISPTGAVVGFHRDATGLFHGLLMVRGEMTSFDVPGASQTRAFGINAAGDVVGYYADSTGFHGFVLAHSELR